MESNASNKLGRAAIVQLRPQRRVARPAGRMALLRPITPANYFTIA